MCVHVCIHMHVKGVKIGLLHGVWHKTNIPVSLTEEQLTSTTD